MLELISWKGGLAHAGTAFLASGIPSICSLPVLGEQAEAALAEVG
jgi:hypothetical protein